MFAELSKIFLLKNTLLFTMVHMGKKHFICAVFLPAKKSSNIALCNLMAADHISISVIQAEI